MKKILLAVFVLVAANAAAQIVTIGCADTIEVGDVKDFSLSVTQYDLNEMDRLEICDKLPKYAIVTKDGKQGVYDMMQHRNITEIVYRQIGFSHQAESEDSTCLNMFYAKKGIKRGVVCIDELSNSVISFWADDPDEVYSLDECTTIDKKITKHVQKLLKGFIKQQQMDNAQIVVLDAKSGLLKTWVRVDSDMEKEEAGMLLVHSCSALLTIPFREGRPLKNTSSRATSPFMMAVGYNSLAHNGTIILPTMRADSVEVEEVFSPDTIASLREVLKVDKTRNPQLSWISEDADWWSYTATNNIYDEYDIDEKTPIGKQILFAGVFPTESPRYTICVVADKNSMDVTPAAFQEVVNPLAKWLLKR